MTTIKRDLLRRAERELCAPARKAVVELTHEDEQRAQRVALEIRGGKNGR